REGRGGENEEGGVGWVERHDVVAINRVADTVFVARVCIQLRQAHLKSRMKLDLRRDCVKCVAEVATTLTVDDSHVRFDGADRFLDRVPIVGLGSVAEE